jgi:predicted ATPase
LYLISLKKAVEQSRSLAELLHHKTNGNPFFLTQLLQALHADKLLSFPPPESPTLLSSPLNKGGQRGVGAWQWNIEQIQAVGITDNVVELMISKIEKLDERTQNVLKLAACIGNRFDLEILSVVNAKSLSDTANELWSALQEGLILPLSNDYKIPLLWNQEAGLTDNSEPSLSLVPNFPSFIPYKFLHDRVQQAAYALIPDDHKKEVHLKVGQLLLKNTQQDQLEENIFDIVNHLNIGAELISHQLDRDELAKFNLIAGKKAKAATAYEPALRYLKTALELLAPDSWQNQYELALDIHVETVELDFLNTHFEEAEFLSDIALREAKNILYKVIIYEIKIQSYLSGCQYQSVTDTGLKVLESLGVSIPESDESLKVLFGRIRRKLSLKGKQIEDLIELPLMTDPYKIAAIRILIIISSAFNMVNPRLYSLTLLTVVNLCVNYGNPPLAAAAYAWTGVLLLETEDIDSAYRFSQLSLKLLEQSNSREVTAKVHHFSYSAIRHWKQDIRETIQPLLEGVNSGLEAGDVEFACYCAICYCLHNFYAGKNLKWLEVEYTKYVDIMISFKQLYSILYTKICRQFVWNLLGKSVNKLLLKSNDFSESEAHQRLCEANDGCSLAVLYFARTIVRYLFKDYPQAIESGSLGEQYEKNNSHMMVLSQSKFY